MDLCQPNVIKSLMESAGLHFRKEFGQNFLIQAWVPREIAAACAPTEDCLILEIGPGIGCLTKELAENYERVVAVEIDRGLIPVLEKTLADYENVTVLNQDIMKTDLAALIEDYGEGRDVYVCANLPYYITTPILMYLLESGVPFRAITVMVQSEVADRLVARAGTSEYGAITAVLGYYGTVTRLFTVSSGCFLPAPKVESTVIRLNLHEEKPYRPRDEKFFFGIVKAAFEQRRKTLVNAISAKYSHLEKDRIRDTLVSLGYSPTVRGETLSTEEFVRLADALCSENAAETAGGEL